MYIKQIAMCLCQFLVHMGLCHQWVTLILGNVLQSDTFAHVQQPLTYVHQFNDTTLILVYNFYYFSR